MASDAPPALVRELVAVPRARFVAERTARAKALRADGRRDEAAAVSKLRKPSVVTWAVNAAARDAPDAAAALVEAVRRMQQPGDIDVRAAAREVDARLDDLVEAGAAALGREGERVDPDRRASLRSALRAAALATDAEAFVGARLPDVDDTGGDANLEAALLAGAHGRAQARRRAAPRSKGRAEAEPDDAAAHAAATRAERRRLQSSLREARSAHAAADHELRAARRTLRAAERTEQEAAARVTELQAELADLPRED